MSPETGLRYEWITDHQRFAELRGDWNSLGTSAIKTIFLTHVWLQTWVQELAPDSELHVLAAWDAEQLVGALPLFADPKVNSGRSWQIMGTGTLTPNHLDVIAEPALAQRVREEFVRMLLEATDDWDTLEFDKLPADTDTAVALADAFGRAGLGSSSTVSAVCPYCDLPASYDQYVASRKKRVRKKLRHALSIFAEECRNASCAMMETEPDALAAFDALVALHQARWTEKGYPGAFASPAVVRFHRALIGRALADGFLRIYTLQDDAQIVAVSYDFEVAEIVQAYLSSFDPQWSEWSPGILLRLFAIEHSIAEGARRFDFLEGVERYKSDWCDCERQNLRVVVYNRTIRGQASRVADAAESAGVRVARKLLPPSLREQLVKLRARRGAESDTNEDSA